MKTYSRHKGTKNPKTEWRGFTVGERIVVKEGMFAGQRGVIASLRSDGRPVFRMANGATMNCEDAGYWSRPDIAPPPTQFYDRHLITLGWGDKAVKAAPR